MQLKEYNLCHYIDNFLLILFPKFSMIHTMIDNFSEVYDIMSFMIEQKKNKKGILIDFLNLKIDIMIMKAYLSSNKHQCMLFIVIDIFQRKFISFHILEKLLDFLSFYYAIISFDKLFLRQIFNLLNRKTHHLAHIQINHVIK